MSQNAWVNQIKGCKWFTTDAEKGCSGQYNIHKNRLITKGLDYFQKLLTCPFVC